MKNFIFSVFLYIAFGFSSITQLMQNGQWFWENHFARQAHLLFNFQPNPDLQKQHQISGKSQIFDLKKVQQLLFIDQSQNKK